MKIFVWDRSWRGAFVIVAETAEEAADRWNKQYPNGIRHRSTDKPTRAVADSFTVHELTEIITTEGDV